MDGERFDRLILSLTQTGTRRGALRTLASTVLGAAGLAGIAASDSFANRKQGRKRNARQKDRHRGAGAEAVAANCCSSQTCTPGAGLDLRKCCYDDDALSGANFRRANLSGASFRGANLTNANFSGANLDKACFVDADITGADLSGVNLKGVIFCRTRTGPNTYDNSGCGKATSCCPTCIPLNRTRCSLGGSCCDNNAVCTGDTCVCRSGRSECDGKCVNLKTDANNCGACGHACPSGETCTNGACGCGAGPTCGQGLTCCSGQCVNLQTDINNCLECGNACPSSLANASVFCGPGVDENNDPVYGCVFLCDKNHRDCNNDWQDGCETTIQNNNFHCGTCSNTDCAASGKECKGCTCLPPGGVSTTCDEVTNAQLIRRR